MQDDARKADTRRKIELGGLVILAGLGELDRAAILGLLIGSKQLASSGDALLRARTLGELAFQKAKAGRLPYG